MDCSRSKSYGKRKKEEVGESMSTFIQKYINLYCNKCITKCVANAIQTSQLFLGEGSKLRTYLLADAVCIIGV